MEWFNCLRLLDHIDILKELRCFVIYDFHDPYYGATATKCDEYNIFKVENDDHDHLQYWEMNHTMVEIFFYLLSKGANLYAYNNQLLYNCIRHEDDKLFTFIMLDKKEISDEKINECLLFACGCEYECECECDGKNNNFDEFDEFDARENHQNYKHMIQLLFPLATLNKQILFDKYYACKFILTYLFDDGFDLTQNDNYAMKQNIINDNQKAVKFLYNIGVRIYIDQSFCDDLVKKAGSLKDLCEAINYQETMSETINKTIDEYNLRTYINKIHPEKIIECIIKHKKRNTPFFVSGLKSGLLNYNFLRIISGQSSLQYSN